MNLKQSELKGLKGTEIDKKLKEAKEELLKLVSQVHGSAPPKNPHDIKNTRKTIARLLTMQRAEVKQ